MFVPLSVRMCITLVTNVSAPLGQLSTNVNNSGDFIPIPFTYNNSPKSNLSVFYAFNQSMIFIKIHKNLLNSNNDMYLL
jgi:hypothetical protein